MSQPYKPDGNSSVSPYLVVEDPLAVVEFLESVFDGTEQHRHEGDDGSVVHTEVLIDDSVVMIGGATDEFPPMTTIVHVYVPDVDAAFERAVDADGTVLQAPRVPEGEREKRGTVEGPGGNSWSISTFVG